MNPLRSKEPIMGLPKRSYRETCMDSESYHLRGGLFATKLLINKIYMKKIIISLLGLTIFSVMFIFNIAYAEQCIAPTTAPVCYDNKTVPVYSIFGEQSDGAFYYPNGTIILRNGTKIFEVPKKQMQVKVSCAGTQKEIDYKLQQVRYDVCQQINGINSSNQSAVDESISQSNINSQTPLPSCSNPFTQEELNNIDSQAPNSGMQKSYNVYEGKREDLPIGPLEYRYSSYNPRTRKDVKEEFSDKYGNTFKKFSDDTSVFFDNNQNYTYYTDAAFLWAKKKKTYDENLSNGTITINSNTSYFKSISDNDYYTPIKNIRSNICKRVELEKKRKDSESAIIQTFFKLEKEKYPDAGITGFEKSVQEVLDKVSKSPSYLAKPDTVSVSAINNNLDIAKKITSSTNDSSIIQLEKTANSKNITLTEQAKEPVVVENREPVKKVSWFRKIFNWFMEK